MTQEDDIFIKKMIGVKPIKKNNTIKKEIKKNKHKPKQTQKPPTTISPDKKAAFEQKKSSFSIEFGQINKGLRRGKINIDKKIDFHGKTLFEAEQDFVSIIRKSYYENKRCLLFITGKGLLVQSQKNKIEDLKNPKLFYGKIRAALLAWSKKPELSKFIITLERARPEHGGDGAFYIYLRKQKI